MQSVVDARAGVVPARVASRGRSGSRASDSCDGRGPVPAWPHARPRKRERPPPASRITRQRQVAAPPSFGLRHGRHGCSAWRPRRRRVPRGRIDAARGAACRSRRRREAPPPPLSPGAWSATGSVRERVGGGRDRGGRDGAGAPTVAHAPLPASVRSRRRPVVSSRATRLTLMSSRLATSVRDRAGRSPTPARSREHAPLAPGEVVEAAGRPGDRLAQAPLPLDRARLAQIGLLQGRHGRSDPRRGTAGRCPGRRRSAVFAAPLPVALPPPDAAAAAARAAAARPGLAAARAVAAPPPLVPPDPPPLARRCPNRRCCLRRRQPPAPPPPPPAARRGRHRHLRAPGPGPRPWAPERAPGRSEPGLARSGSAPAPSAPAPARWAPGPPAASSSGSGNWANAGAAIAIVAAPTRKTPRIRNSSELDTGARSSPNQSGQEMAKPRRTRASSISASETISGGRKRSVVAPVALMISFCSSRARFAISGAGAPPRPRPSARAHGPKPRWAAPAAAPRGARRPRARARGTPRRR